MKKKYSISVISKACGILPHTLRAWESRYNMFSPTRDEAGKRAYTEADLKKAVALAALVAHGYAISSLSQYDQTELENLAKSIDQTQTNQNQISAEVNTKKLVKYLASYELDLVSKELQYLRLSTGTKDFILNTILPTMREIGFLVEQNKYTVTQEHIMSTIVRDQLSQINLPNLNDKSTEIAIATPEGNLHELAIIIANILCRSHKFTTRYLGAAHPPECLAEAVNILKTPVLVLGVVTSDSWNYQERIIPYLKQIDHHLNEDIEVLLGGGNQLEFPKFNKIKNIKIIPTFQDFDKYLEEIF